MLRLAWPRSCWLRIALTLGALAVVALPYLHALGAWPLLEPDEGRNAEVAREMLELGTWSVPHFNHLPYLDKPVLLFWAITAAFRTLGVTEFAARLPSVLGAIATVWAHLRHGPGASRDPPGGDRCRVDRDRTPRHHLRTPGHIRHAAHGPRHGRAALSSPGASYG